ncbi:MAG: isochorismatase family protein [Odoribacter sp.]|nr:isochorismatase family protein [Odoribacter sp.]
MKTILFIIDMQNDFCKPEGNLYVPGADMDVQRLGNLIIHKKEVINEIILTQDNHQVMDIAHSCFWINSKGEHPEPFTVITSEDILANNWIPVFDKDKTLFYLQELEKADEFPHTIWPEHCLWGSEGAAIIDELMQKIIEWARTGKYFEIVSKGAYPFTEHFGAFRANVPIEDVHETHFNLPLLDKLNTADTIWMAGEAKSHCVANTLKQLFDFPEIVSKLVLLEDCMSNILGCDKDALPIYERAKTMGAQFTTSIDILNA